MYKYIYFKIEIKTKVDSYMPCEAMAHSTKYGVMDIVYIFHIRVSTNLSHPQVPVGLSVGNPQVK